MKIACLLDQFCEQSKTAITFGDNTGYTLQIDDMENLRKPDASVVLLSRLPGEKIPSTRFQFSPDLAVEAVEVISPSDVHDDLETKIQEYLNAGTQLVWLAKPKSKKITVYLLDGSEQTFGINDEINAEPLLPVFITKVKDVFPA